MALILLGSGAVGQSTAGVEVTFVDTIRPSLSLWAEITRRLANGTLATTVHTWLDATLNADASTYYAGRKAGDVLRMSPLTRALSDDSGSLQQSTAEVTLSNSDRVWTTRLLTETVKNQLLVLRVIDRVRAAALGVPKVIARLQQQSPTPNADGSITFRGQDSVAALVGGGGSDLLQVPRLQITRRHFPKIDASSAVLNQGIPMWYGAHLDTTPGYGPIPLIPIDYPYFLDNALLEFGLCLAMVGACQSMPALYVNKKLVSAGDSVFVRPGGTYWNAQTTLQVGGLPVTYYTLPSGVRVTCVFVFGGSWQAVLDGQLKLTCTLNGYENSATGNGTGTLITSGPSQLLHFLKNAVFGQMTSTPIATPMAPDGSPYLNEASFLAVEAKQTARLAGGYPLRWGVGPDRQKADEVIADVVRSMGCRIGQTWGGALSLHTFDRAQAPSQSLAPHGTKTIVLKDSFTPSVDDSQHANQVDYDYGHLYSRSGMLISDAHVRDITSIAKYTRVYRTHLSLPAADKAVADDVAYRELLMRTDPPQFGDVAASFGGLDGEVGGTFHVTHPVGPQAVAGAVLKPYWIERLSFDPATGRVDFTGRDQQATATSLPIWRAVTSITRVGTVATVAMTAHAFVDGDVVTFRNAVPTAYNGSKTIVFINANSFSFQVDVTAATPATGTIEAGSVDLGQEQVIPADVKVTDDATRTGPVIGGYQRYELGGRLDVGENTSAYKKLLHYAPWVDNKDDNGGRRVYVRYWMYTANTATSVRFRLVDDAGATIYESPTSTSLLAGYPKKGVLVKIDGNLTADEHAYYGEYKGSNATNQVFCKAAIEKR